MDGQRIFNTIAYMAPDQFLGRKPNTPEFEELQDWVINPVFHREHQLAYSGVFYSFSKLNLKIKTMLP